MKVKWRFPPTKGEANQYEAVVKHGKTRAEMELDPNGKGLEKE